MSMKAICLGIVFLAALFIVLFVGCGHVGTKADEASDEAAKEAQS